ncbi:hypothetical protein AQUCO_07700011v1 [Aquilegia coerulea]|uniref:Cytochrome P450 n=1 Tax=Aquilegia coerulea TaxID=218851 RepID=A0A2G5C842_AQUCA|nr:hypothetical protein AQUCO_07700011v1 [Aquilegia coerulea]
MLVKQISKRLTSKTSPSSSLLPPGPSKLPVIGHLHHLVGSLPHHSLKDLAKIHGPIMYLKFGEVSAVVISSPSVVKQMMKTHDLMFVDRPLNLAAKIMSYQCKDVVMAPYGEYWRQVRKICILELLSAKRVQSFWRVREEEVSNLIQRISSKADGSQVINLSEKIFTLTNDITARATFGKTCKDKQAPFISVIKEVIRLASGFDIADLFPSLKFMEVISGTKPKIERMHQKVDKMLNDIIKEHKQNRMARLARGEAEEELVLDVLLRLLEGRELDIPITMDNVKAVTLDMFFAGTDTSSTVTEWAFAELLRNPRAMKKAQAEVRRIFNGKKKIDQADMNELSYLRLVIKEALRLHPPAPLLVPRECRETCEMVGYEIPKGCKVIVNAWAMGRDPENWSDPESFEPERFEDVDIDYKGTNFKYIPFGGGRRICPGILFGIANIELPLALLLYHFDWKLADGIKPEQLDMTEAFSAVVKRQNSLYVIPTTYIDFRNNTRASTVTKYSVS